ncbi:HAD family hydrolase [Dictyobacter arantiisoli]|uniref:Beta-phosphoglucomutase n=1 Tax=Dictyobacter arantiisoli TaxID=2014874 RepID=A0A5A5THG6_9CHLR|nr:HAD family phosphatase [Dictyobacter arantiisoli]GCF10586.1 beta-phosphoglucomutase [Dictyobacter arantiisoli]
MTDYIHAVIWDLDGVIIDSGEEHKRSWYRVAAEEGLPFSDQQFDATFGMRNDAIIPLIWGVTDKKRIQELADKKEVYYREFIHIAATALPGALELLSALKEAGYKQALASSAPGKNIEAVSAALGLEQYLDVLVSGETVPHGKPAPDVFLKAATELGVEPAHSLVIEDAVAGVQAAKAGGMFCLAVAGERDLPGLRAANLVVKSLAEVKVATIRQGFLVYPKVPKE